MFPKGPRFIPPKTSDTPGPNAYDVNEEALEAYKRGGFLETANRFSKDKLSEVPGPGSSKHETNAKINAAPKLSQTNDRYATLQRRVEELERVHNESKKTHQIEIERLKADFARVQKSNNELNDRLEKNKKHGDLLEGKYQELRKANLSDQSEIKDLRVKLRLSEHERSQLSEKQEKAVASERKKREAAETQLQGLRGRGDTEVREMRATTQGLEARLKEAQEETKKVSIAASETQQAAAVKDAELLNELECHKALLQRVAQEYSRLASSTVTVNTHKRLKREHTALQVQVTRLERKLANTEGQVVELAHLIRNTKSENDLLRRDISELEWDIRALWPSHPGNVYAFNRDYSLEDMCSTMEHEARAVNEATQAALMSAYHSMHDFYRLNAREIEHAYLLAEVDLTQTYLLSNQLTTALHSAACSKTTLESELESHQAQLASSQQLLLQARTDLMQTTKRVTEVEAKYSELDAQAAANTTKLKQEKGSVQRLTLQLTQAKETEEALQAEMEQLSSDLTEAERYQEAYANLYEQVADLAARNELAENEAERLSKFNAEIVGHANPAQRIMYLDRIRTELADTKHKLLTMTRAHESASADNDVLRREVELYKSVTAHPSEKIRTNVTRVHRPPLQGSSTTVKES